MHIPHYQRGMTEGKQMKRKPRSYRNGQIGYYNKWGVWTPLRKGQK